MALGAAPWAPQLTYLRFTSGPGAGELTLLGDPSEARAAVEALAAAPLTSLRTLDFGVWVLPLEAMLVVVRAPWFSGLSMITMHVDTAWAAAQRAHARPTTHPPNARGHARAPPPEPSCAREKTCLQLPLPVRRLPPPASLVMQHMCLTQPAPSYPRFVSCKS